MPLFAKALKLTQPLRFLCDRLMLDVSQRFTRRRDHRRVSDSQSRQVTQSRGERNCHILVVWWLIDLNAVDGATQGALQQSWHLLPACTTLHCD